MFEAQRGLGHQRFGPILSKTKFAFTVPNVWNKMLAMPYRRMKTMKGETLLLLKGPWTRLN